MEIRIDNAEQGIANYEPLIAWATERTSAYKGLVVQEDGIAAAKADVADLRRLAKSASDYRIRIKKEHEAKIAETINQLKELTDIFTNTAEAIAVQIRSFEEQEKETKKQEIISFFNDHVGDLEGILRFDSIFNDKWLNKTASMQSITDEIADRIKQTRNDIETIRDMHTQYENEMVSEYLKEFSVGAALNKKKMLEEQQARIEEMQRRKAEANAQMAAKQSELQQIARPAPAPAPISAPVPEHETKPADEQIYTIDLRIYVTQAQKKLFRDFLVNSGIKYSSIPKNN